MGRAFIILPAKETLPKRFYISSSLPAVKTDGLAQRQPSHHPGKQNQVTLVAGRAVLTQEADQLSMQLGKGCHGDLVWSDSPTLSWLPANPID
jgi:hypothetical protein